MMDDGIRLYPEVDRLDETLGVLLSHMRPPNVEAVAQSFKALTLVIEACQRYLLEQVDRNYPKGEPGTEEQRKFNYTRHRIRLLANKYRREMRRQLKKNVWKG